MPNKDYPWDPYSDQPHILKDKKFKRHLYIKGLWSSIKTFLYIPVLPLIALRILFSSKKQTYNAVSNIGLCVNVSKPTEKQTHQTNDELAALVNELGVNDLLIRIPLSDIENLDNYHDLAKKLSDKCILINILQDRDHIEDPTLLKSDLRTVFSRFRDISNVFQIANSINRKKWGFVTTNEYLKTANSDLI